MKTIIPLIIDISLLTLVGVYLWKEGVVEDDNYSPNSRDFQRYSSILDKLGYLPVPSQADRILYDVAKVSIETQLVTYLVIDVPTHLWICIL